MGSNEGNSPSTQRAFTIKVEKSINRLHKGFRINWYFKIVPIQYQPRWINKIINRNKSKRKTWGTKELAMWAEEMYRSIDTNHQSSFANLAKPQVST